MPFYPGDYLASTSHLTTTEHGAYLLLIFHYWSTQKPLPANDQQLARITKLTLDEWMSVREVISEFFQIVGEKWVSHRIDREIREATANKERKSAAGKKAADARWNKEKEGHDESLAH